MTGSDSPQQGLPASHRTDGSSPAIDAATLAQLNQLDPTGTQDVVRRVLETYARSLERSMPEFETARAAQDATALGRLAHTLRSSSASVGALSFSAHCKTVETLVREGRLDELPSALDALQNESVRVRAELAAMLAARGKAT